MKLRLKLLDFCRRKRSWKKTKIIASFAFAITLRFKIFRETQKSALLSTHQEISSNQKLNINSYQ